MVDEQGKTTLVVLLCNKESPSHAPCEYITTIICVLTGLIQDIWS